MLLSPDCTRFTCLCGFSGGLLQSYVVFSSTGQSVHFGQMRSAFDQFTKRVAANICRAVLLTFTARTVIYWIVSCT